MKIISKLLTLMLLTATASGPMSANASTITYDVRAITNGVNMSDYKASWLAQTSGIILTSLSDFNGVTPANYGYSSYNFDHLTVDFTAGSALNALFQLAPDAGFGGALYIDGTLVDRKAYNLWWGGSWSATSQLLTTSPLSLTAGNHVLEAFWAEDCCSGPAGGRLSVDNGAHWQNLSVANLNPLAVSAVPEPATLTLLGLGLLGFGAARRRKQ